LVEYPSDSDSDSEEENAIEVVKELRGEVDVVLVGGGKKIYAHKAILCQRRFLCILICFIC